MTLKPTVLSWVKPSPMSLDRSMLLIIDKGISNGVLVGQPVIDTNGYVIGTVKTRAPAAPTSFRSPRAGTV